MAEAEAGNIKLSVIVVFYDMAREAPRTLHSLSPAYQTGLDADEYEVIAVDNGSPTPLDAAMVAALPGNFRLIRIDDASPSPAAAINRGLREARGALVGVMIDGARLVTPGLLFYALHAVRLHRRAIVAPLSYYLGPDRQAIAVAHGYDQTREDALLESIGWPRDGYRLFEIATPDESTIDGWFAEITESNSLFLSREDWEQLGGYDERFDAPGGGLLNLDTYRRAMELPDARRVTPLGEATFHQVHGGIATNSSTDEFLARLDGWFSQYTAIRGRRYAPPAEHQPPIYIGPLPPPALSRFARAATQPGRTGLTPPLGPAFDHALWCDGEPPLPEDHVAAQLTLLARDAFSRRAYEAVASIARLTYARYPDEPEPQRLLSLTANYLPRGRDLPFPELRGDYHLALGKAHLLLDELARALQSFRAALDSDPGLAEAAAAITELEQEPMVKEAAGGPSAFRIAHTKLYCPKAGPGSPSLRASDALHFDAETHTEPDGAFLFFGPYIPLNPGVYLFAFRGELDGTLLVDFAHDGGPVLKEVGITGFDQPVCVVVTKPLGNFEVRGRKTAETRTMRLSAIDVERIG